MDPQGRADGNEREESAMSDTKPTIVLVHGAWADAWSWAGVIERLQRDGFTCTAPPNNLRGPTADAAVIRSYLQTLPGPVVLVAHSYGGFVITNAATGLENVKALVYVDAFIPDAGQPAGALTGPESALAAAATNPASLFKLVPNADGVVDGYLLPETVATSFAQDLSTEQIALITATQRPAAVAGFGEPSGPPAWQGIPSWAVIGTQDRIITPGSQRQMAGNAHATVVEIDASHVSMISKPDAIVEVIETAAAQVA
jgi:pimeloyl-ACP methyl ester carboxylesterase